MDTYDEQLGRDIDAWVEDQPAASPERYASIRQHLEGDLPAVDQEG
ncbi:hypothetical protein [Streptomyces sp. NPDC048637]